MLKTPRLVIEPKEYPGAPRYTSGFLVKDLTLFEPYSDLSDRSPWSYQVEQLPKRWYLGGNYSDLVRANVQCRWDDLLCRPDVPGWNGWIRKGKYAGEVLQ